MNILNTPGGDDPILEDANQNKIVNEEDPLTPETENQQGNTGQEANTDTDKTDKDARNK